MKNPPSKLIVVLGPSASGKTALGAALAKRLNGENISGDSRQVFRRMERHGTEIVWLPGESDQATLALQHIESVGVGLS